MLYSASECWGLTASLALTQTTITMTHTGKVTLIGIMNLVGTHTFCGSSWELLAQVKVVVQGTYAQLV